MDQDDINDLTRWMSTLLVMSFALWYLGLWQALVTGWMFARAARFFEWRPGAK